MQQKEKDKLEVSQFEEKNKSGALDKSVETLRNKLDVMEQELENFRTSIRGGISVDGWISRGVVTCSGDIMMPC